MTTVTFTINGQEVSAPAGTTILKAAQDAGIDIPTLCHHPALPPVGGCRICLVDVKGQRTLQTACTFPVSEGMEVQTDNERVLKARKLVLDLLFSERNHFCMYCEMSGDCELQKLGYRYGIDHWVYPAYTQPFPVDATRKFFLMDHNRCVLCGRCIRACAELAANHTLELRERGTESMVSADGNSPFGASSCVACGSCLQVCPTGALFERRSAFMGRSSQAQFVKSTCAGCSLGCGITIVTRGDNVLRIEGDWDALTNKGVLCRMGRFDPLYEERVRLTQPLVKTGAGLVPATWEEALQAVAKRIGAVAAAEIGVLTTSSATNEALYALQALFRKGLGVTNMGLLNKVAPLAKRPGALTDLDGSDLIVVAGADPVKEQPVVSFRLKKNIDRGARLILVTDATDSELAAFASFQFRMAEIDKALKIAARADAPVVLYGAAVTPAVLAALETLPAKTSFLALQLGVNTRAALALGLANGFVPTAAKLLYVLLGEDTSEKVEVGDGTFLVVQTVFASLLTAKADVVLPAASWSERAGSLTDTQGHTHQLAAALAPKGNAKPDWEVLTLLARALGKNIGNDLADIAAQAAREIK